jgi:hypothetical protein
MFNSFALGNSFDFKRLKEKESDIKKIENYLINGVEKELKFLKPKSTLRKITNSSLLMKKIH